MNLRQDENGYPNPKPPYLRHGPSGYVYIYSDHLYDQGDMHPCYDIPDAQLPPEKRAAKKAEKQASVMGEDLVVETPDYEEKSLLKTGLEELQRGPDGDTDKPVRHMNMDELLVHAKKNFGADIDPVIGLPAVRAEIFKMQEALETSEGSDTNNPQESVENDHSG